MPRTIALVHSHSSTALTTRCWTSGNLLVNCFSPLPVSPSIIKGIEGALAGLSLGLRTIDGLSKLGEKVKSVNDKSTGKDPGRVYYKVRELKENRTILAMSESLKESSENQYAMSPALAALRGLFGPEKFESGVVYILYDEAGNGKTTAGEALLNEWRDLGSGKKVKGFMLGGDALGDNLVQSMMTVNELDSANVQGWIHVLLHALNEPDEEAPSILILDGVNSLGEEQINKKFIKALYDSMKAEKNIFIVVICQDRDVATEFCGLNKGKRVVPMPGFYTGDSQTSPEWKNTTWSRDLLMQMLHVKHPEKFTDEMLEFIDDGMTPVEVMLKARKELRTKSVAPESPKKRKRSR